MSKINAVLKCNVKPFKRGMKKVKRKLFWMRIRMKLRKFINSICFGGDKVKIKSSLKCVAFGVSTSIAGLKIDQWETWLLILVFVISMTEEY